MKMEVQHIKTYEIQKSGSKKQLIAANAYNQVTRKISNNLIYTSRN